MQDAAGAIVLAPISPYRPHGTASGTAPGSLPHTHRRASASAEKIGDGRAVGCGVPEPSSRPGKTAWAKRAGGGPRAHAHPVAGRNAEEANANTRERYIYIHGTNHERDDRRAPSATAACGCATRTWSSFMNTSSRPAAVVRIEETRSAPRHGCDGQTKSYKNVVDYRCKHPWHQPKVCSKRRPARDWR